MKSINQLTKVFSRVRKDTLRLGVVYFFVNLAIALLQLTYLNLRYEYLVDRVPLFYTFSWGQEQLAARADLFMIPALSIGISLLGLLFFYYLSARHYKFGPQLLFFIVLFTNSFLTYSLFRSIRIGLVTENPLISEELLGFLVPFLVALGTSSVLSFSYVKLMRKWGIVTDPALHDHPGMLLTRPSARGGGLFFALIFSVLVLIFVPLTPQIVGILLTCVAVAVLGILDDYQNTHPASKLSFLENPLIRLVGLFFLVSLLYFFGTNIYSLTNPFDGVLNLTGLDFHLGGVLIQPLSWFVTTAWVVWLLNLLSWSNGVDGQYSGVVGIAFVVLAFLALRFDLVTALQMNYAKILFIAAGVSLGLVAVTWFPSKMMWGFGAVSAGLVLAAMSILVRAKVITSVLILLVPFLDAVVTLVRRVSEGKSPLKGDRGHFHHLLIDKGFSVPQVALFYWVVTMFFGALGLFTADNVPLQTGLAVAGVVLFSIVLTNLRLSKEKSPQPESE
jgi:UDP-GlcNAc:undecaprenyl-phosphate/decaprenyl-phosphate GlcNAc-1-phosphate transferase